VAWPALAGGLAATALALAPAWKWQLGLRRVALGLGALALAAAAVVTAADALAGLPAVAQAALGGALTLAGGLAVLAHRFYRDPEREPPPRGDVVISPADGEVVYVRRSRGGRLPVATKRGRDVALEELTRTPVHEGDAIVVGIGMSFLDVHVNRAPVAGEVRVCRHFAGRFGSLGRPEMVFENERATTVIAAPGLEVAVVQIASRLVRQIASYVDEGQRVALGQRIGVIRLGSQVDVVLPDRDDVRVLVRPGDRVRAGDSVVATFAPERSA
jgi:phosphatidylserine decarboxylase